MFEVKPYSPENYTELSEWWKDWKWDPVPEAYLPPDGLIVSFEGKNICAVFLYRTNTPICWAENYISIKECDRHTRQWALDILITSAVEKAASFGFDVVMSSINHPVLGKRLKKCGFMVTDTNMTMYMRKV